MRQAALTILGMTFGALALNAQMAAVQTPAQAGNPLISEAKQAYNSVKNNLTAMAAKMPPADYEFKATPDVRTFGAVIAHVADTQMRACASSLGEQKSVDAASKTAKDDLVTALKASFDECDAAFAALNDSNAQQLIGAGRMQRSRLGTLINSVIVHDNEEYGYMSVYLRLKGVVPPSSDRPMGRGMGGR